jgi:hypothetical protein
MTTIKEFIEYLKTLPPDTEISVLRTYTSGYNTIVERVPLNLDPIEENVEFIDLTGNKFVKKDDDGFNKKYLVLGSEE